MRILLLAPSRSIHTHRWASYYKNHGIEVRVATFEDHYSEENAKEIDTVILKKKAPGKLSYITSVFQLKEILKSYKPDILHAHYASSYGLVGALANYHPYYVSVWGRDVYIFPKQNAMNRMMVEYTLKKAEVICSTSHVMAKETSQYTNKRIEVTPFGVDMNFFKPIPHEKSGIVTIGTVKALSDKYGIADLIRAFEIVYRKYQKINLLIVGDGHQKEEYMELTKQLGVEQVTLFTGRVPSAELANYMTKINIFAVPSTEDSESFGVAAVEAMSCGIPVIVSNVGGLPEVVKKDVTGYVIEKNNPEQLAKVIEKLLIDPALCKKMGQAGINHVKKNYDWENNAALMIKLYNKTLKK